MHAPVTTGFVHRVMLAPRRAWDRLAPWLARPDLGRWLVLLALVLSSSALFLGFYLDDYVGRYIYSDLEGAARLFRNYGGGYGLATGDPAENRWQMEAGWAPWWQYENLRLILYRPIGVAVHMLDFRGWRDNAFLMHAHSLLWLGGMVAALTWMYRIALGPLLGGAAALLFAIDHTHGFAVGHICNRHALISVLFGALTFGFHLRQRRSGALRDAWQGPLFYVLGLLTSESTIAIAGYVVAYALCVEQGSWRKRALGVAPYVVITGVWRALYNAAGFGAVGSGVYIDLGREPLVFARAFLDRAPIFWLGQFLAPPAEAYVSLPELPARLMWLWAALVLAASLWTFTPVLRRDPWARCWMLGMVGAIVPAAASFPHNRQLIFASIGAMGVLARLWQNYASEPVALWSARTQASQSSGASTNAHASFGSRAGAQLTRVALYCGQGFGVLLLFGRLVCSPLTLPLSTASVALNTPMHSGAATVGDEVAGRDLVFVTAPEFYSVRMVQLLKRLAGAPLPRRIRAMSCEYEPIDVKRSGERTLDVHFQSGIMSRPMIGDLHRDRRLPMPRGTKVHISGFDVEVLHATPDGRPDVVRFSFEKPLEDPSLAFYRWHDRGFVPFHPPPLGAEVALPGADIPIGLK